MKLQIAQGVIRGMNYLHTKNPPVVHADLKVQNVLVGDAYKAKVNTVSFFIVCIFDLWWQWRQLYLMQVICISLQIDNHTSISSLNFLQAECASCHPANSVKALKAFSKHIT